MYIKKGFEDNFGMFLPSAKFSF